MKPYSNLPSEQHRGQRLANQFNADARLWERLEPRRRLRRKTRAALTAQQHKALDLLEFARTRPPQDCVGEEIQP